MSENRKRQINKSREKTCRYLLTLTDLHCCVHAFMRACVDTCILMYPREERQYTLNRREQENG